jgi:hypothetical protein
VSPSAAELPPLPSGAAAIEAALAAGLPGVLVDALTGDAVAEDPGVIGEWVTWLRLWRARLAEEGLPEKVRRFWGAV